MHNKSIECARINRGPDAQTARASHFNRYVPKLKIWGELIFPVLTLLVIVGCTSETGSELISVTGTVNNVLLVAEDSWLGDSAKLSYQVLTLSNGKKYHLTPEQGKGIGKGFDVELTLVDNSKPNSKGEYEVHSAKITAIPIPGENRKLKYPPTTPPLTIEKNEK